MYAMKGSWVGQTFALAKMNEAESGGRKARVRRSIEERKTMAESFIKKYQTLNNGTFPSLNLTHKEVGGSFYTVREIVREIIQENRVLGPAKLTNDNTNIFSQEYPLGSIAVEPQIRLDSQNKNPSMIHIVPNQGQSEEVALSSNGQYDEVQHLTNVDGIIKNIDSEICIGRENLEKGNVVLETIDQMVENGKFVNVHTVEIERKEETDKFRITESEFCMEEKKIEEKNAILETLDEKLENGKFVSLHSVEIGEKEECDQFKSIESEIFLEGEKIEEENIILETHNEKVDNGKFVSRHNVEITEKEDYDELNSIGSEVSKSVAEKTDDMKTEIAVETFPVRPVSHTTSMFDIAERKNDEDEADNIQMDDGSVLTDFEETSSCLTPDDIEAKLAADSLLENNVISGDELETSLEKDEELPAQNQLVDEPKGNFVDNLIDTVPLISESTVEGTNSKPDDKLRGGPTKTRTPTTLDRINLESWESTSKKRGRSEINPFLKAITAFITAFIKFWSE